MNGPEQGNLRINGQWPGCGAGAGAEELGFGLGLGAVAQCSNGISLIFLPAICSYLLLVCVFLSHFSGDTGIPLVFSLAFLW